MAGKGDTISTNGRGREIQLVLMQGREIQLVLMAGKGDRISTNGRGRDSGRDCN